MNLSILKINNKLVDYKLSDSNKELSDFSKSLVKAGYPFWFDKGVKVENLEVQDLSEAMNTLIKVPFANKRAFETLTIPTIVHTKVTYCWCCGFNVKNNYNFCPICGEKLN